MGGGGKNENILEAEVYLCFHIKENSEISLKLSVKGKKQEFIRENTLRIYVQKYQLIKFSSKSLFGK